MTHPTLPSILPQIREGDVEREFRVAPGPGHFNPVSAHADEQNRWRRVSIEEKWN